MLFLFLLLQCSRATVPVLQSFSRSERTMFDIVWSCASTVVLCAWVTARPDVLPQSRRQAWWKRFKLMFWMILAPELVLVWAVRQRRAALMVANEYKGKHFFSQLFILANIFFRPSGMDDYPRIFLDYGWLDPASTRTTSLGSYVF